MESIMQWFFSGVGIVCLLFGAHLAVKTRIEEFRDGPPPPPPQSATVRKVEREHAANWGAAEGFAMAGGLCLIAAALVHRGRPGKPWLESARADSDLRALVQHPLRQEDESDCRLVLKRGRAAAKRRLRWRFRPRRGRIVMVVALHLLDNF